MNRSEQPQTIPFPREGAEPGPPPAERPRVREPNPWPPLIFAVLMCAFWVGGGFAYGWGYFGPGGVLTAVTRLRPPVVAVGPPILTGRGAAGRRERKRKSEGVRRCSSQLFPDG